MSLANYWISELALMASGLIYVHTMEAKPDRRVSYTVSIVLYLIYAHVINQLPLDQSVLLELAARLIGFVFVIHFIQIGHVMTRTAAVYYAIWAFMTWQLLFELWLFIANTGNNGAWWKETPVYGWIVEILVFDIGYLIAGFTIGKWMPEGGKKKIGPRQLLGALLTFVAFEITVFAPGKPQIRFTDLRWVAAYLTQLLLGVILYLENELFKKSELRQELQMLNLLHDNAKEQYELSKANIALINQKCHDMKHQIRALRMATREELEQYLDEIEDHVRIYDAIVKTGNEVLDTILTEKSLICKERGISISCVADGSQMDFINTIDLYAILGNAIDNAMEAVQKFETQVQRQIDVLVYRKQKFLAINVMNPYSEDLVFENEIPKTTKRNKSEHGFGLKSIEYIVSKYHGAMSIQNENGVFSLMLLIPIPGISEKETT